MITYACGTQSTVFGVTRTSYGGLVGPGWDSNQESSSFSLSSPAAAVQAQPLPKAFPYFVADMTEFGVDGSRHAQESPRGPLQAAHGALGVFDLTGDPRAVVVVGSADVREAQFAGRALQEA